MDILFFAKKLLGSLLMPSTLLFIVIIVAWVCYKKKAYKLAKTLALICSLVYYLMSTATVANLLVSSLERQYPPYQGQAVDYVLVLGGGHASSPERPLSSLLVSTSLNRLIEGLMIYRANPGAKLLLSGYEGPDVIPHALAASKVAVALGVPEQDIVLAENVKDTAEEARHWVSFMGDAKMALVTSASHMPRSVYLFERELNAKNQRIENLVPAPTNFEGCVHHCFRWWNWMPKGQNIETVDKVWHEYLGMIWARMQAG